MNYSQSDYNRGESNSIAYDDEQDKKVQIIYNY
jgi:hypothetical protein